MSERVIIAVVIGLCGTAAAALWGGRYTTSPVQQGAVYVVDRFSGEARFCDPRECRPVEQEALSVKYEQFLKTGKGPDKELSDLLNSPRK
jgi:hypothetical protein